ncbi:MAG: DJ-1/PfpI family protein [Clostridia bacterium]|nr:DJ-1/PfpI family protein [Clostridia bacterium]
MIYCFLAEGFEETEAIAPIDMLKRAKKEVITVGVGGEIINGAHNIPVKCDITAEEIELSVDVEAIILPGGMPGTLNLEKNSIVQSAIDFCVENKKYVCAICAAPSILGHKGILEGKEAIAYPGFEKDLKGAKISKKSVVTDGLFITAKGAGVAVDFGLEIVSNLCSKADAEEIKAAIQCL